MNIKIDKQKLSQYILDEEVVFQYGGELVEVAHGKDDTLSKELSDVVRQSPDVKIVSFDEVKDDFFDLVDWAIEESDILIFVDYDVLICIPKTSIARLV